MAKRFSEVRPREETAKSYFEVPESPKFQEVAEIWLAEVKAEWSHSHLVDAEGVLNKYLLPIFGSLFVNSGALYQFLF
ncbi:hypothetical protein [Vibrio cionasavignyae]|uniref:hypothetical protein n=1 Tax=Vibrio cionasavignyae TaxID=2910252 RepID=UPI003D12CAB8